MVTSPDHAFTEGSDDPVSEALALTLSLSARTDYLNIPRRRSKNPLRFLGGWGCSMESGVGGAFWAARCWGGRAKELADAAGSAGRAGCPRSQPATRVPPPPCNWHCSTGCVPSIKYSVRTLGHAAVASCPDAGSIWTPTTPAGAANSLTFRYSRCSWARFINSAHTGSAECAPSRLSSRLSSNPTHTTQISFDVKPANQPSCEVPVLPAIGKLIPRDHTLAPVPVRTTASKSWSIRKATRGSSTSWCSGLLS